MVTFSWSFSLVKFVMSIIWVSCEMITDITPPRLVTDRSSINAELKDEKTRRVEFFSGATDVLSALDHIGYKVMSVLNYWQSENNHHWRSYQAHHMWLEPSSTVARTSYGHFTNNLVTTLTDVSAWWFLDDLQINFIWQHILLPLILTFILKLCWIKDIGNIASIVFIDKVKSS